LKHEPPVDGLGKYKALTGLQKKVTFTTVIFAMLMPSGSPFITGFLTRRYALDETNASQSAKTYYSFVRTGGNNDRKNSKSKPGVKQENIYWSLRCWYTEEDVKTGASRVAQSFSANAVAQGPTHLPRRVTW
jgi:hypothetical protein